MTANRPSPRVLPKDEVCLHCRQSLYKGRQYRSSLVPRPSAASFLFAYMTFEPLSDKLAEGVLPLLRHLQAKWTRL